MSRRGSWVYALALLALSILLARSFFVVSYLPTNDGPEHVFATYLEDHYSDPGTAYADLLTPAPEFAARGFTLLYGPLFDTLGWRVGLQWALVVLALTSAFGFVSLVFAVNPGRWPLAFLGFPLALTWELYMGFFPFTVGSGVGLFILTLAVRWTRPTTLQRVVIGLLLLLQGVCHVFTAVLTGLVIGALLTWRAAERSRTEAVRELGRVILMGAPAMAVLAASAVFGASLRETAFANDFLVLPLLETVLVFPRWIAPGPPLRALAALAGLVIAIALAGRQAFRKGADATDRALLAVGVLFLSVGLCAPVNLPGWQLFSPRFLPLGVLLCLVAVPIERLAKPALRLFVPGVLFCVSGAWIVTSYALHHRLAASVGDAIRGLSARVERHGVWLPITLAPEGGLSPYPEVSEIPFLAPLRHMPMLYAVAEGGISPYTFANNAATYSFVVRKGLGRVPPVPQATTYAPLIESEAFGVDLELRHRVVGELANYGMRYEGVLVTAARPDDIALLRKRGYAEDWAYGSTFVGHFVPCTVDLTIPSDGDVPEVDLRVQANGKTHYEAGTATKAPDGTRHLLLPGAPCGDVRVRPHWDTKPTGSTVTSRYCSNANADGDIPATVTHEAAKVTCEGGGL